MALLSYRSKPHCGGQGVYLRHLSRELVALGHHVEVLSGQPYPELDDDEITLHQVPSLDLYADDDPFRTPKLSGVPRLDRRPRGRPHADRRLPRAADLQPARAARAAEAPRRLRRRARQPGARLRQPRASRASACRWSTSIHHPISVDRRIEIEAAKGLKQRFGKRRWYGFVAHAGPRRPAGRPDPDRLGVLQARHRPRLQGAARTTCTSSRSAWTPDLPPARRARVPGRIVAVASADSPIKGVATLLRAVAKLATERDVHLIVVSKPTPAAPPSSSSRELSLGDRVRFVIGISDEELGELLATARDRRRPLPVRGLLAARRRAHGLGHPARRQPYRRAARGGRRRGASWSSPATSRSSPPPCAGCTTPPRSGQRVGAAGLRAGHGTLHLARRRAGHRRALPGRHRPVRGTAARRSGRSRALLTVDFDRFRIAPGEQVLDMGCGAGRHAFEVYRRGAHVVAFDTDETELAAVATMFGAMELAGRGPRGRLGQDRARRRPRACRSPTTPSTRSSPRRCWSTSPTTWRRWPSCSACSSRAAGSPSPCRAGCPSGSAGRCRRTTTPLPAGTSASTPAPSWRPSSRPPASGSAAHHHAHGLHAPYWWIKCAVGVDNDEHPLAKAYHQVLVWDIMKRPARHPAGRARAQPGHRQERRRLLHQARSHRAADAGATAMRRPDARTRVPDARGDAESPPHGASPRQQEPSGRHPVVRAHRRRPRPRRRLEPRRVPRWRCPWPGSPSRPAGRTTGCAPSQREDGSWPAKWVLGEVTEPGGESNHAAYVAVGRLARAAGHRRRARSPSEMWPTVRRAVDFVLGLQTARGEIIWIRHAGRLARRSRAAHRLLLDLPGAALRGRPRRAPGRATARLGARRRPARPRASPATRRRSPTRAGSRWTGTTRSSAARYAAPPAYRADRRAVGHLRRRRAWAAAASSDQPWVTGAETCELVLALDAMGDPDGRGSCSRRCSTCGTRTARTGRAGSSPTSGTSPATAPPTPPPPWSWRPTPWPTPPRPPASSRRSPDRDLGPSGPSDPVACGCEAPSAATVRSRG